MKSEQLKKEFAEKWRHGFAFYSGHQEQEFMSDLNTLIEAVIAERMPTDLIQRLITFTETTEVNDYPSAEEKFALLSWLRSCMKQNV